MTHGEAAVILLARMCEELNNNRNTGCQVCGRRASRNGIQIHFHDCILSKAKKFGIWKPHASPFCACVRAGQQLSPDKVALIIDVD